MKIDSAKVRLAMRRLCTWHADGASSDEAEECHKHSQQVGPQAGGSQWKVSNQVTWLDEAPAGRPDWLVVFTGSCWAAVRAVGAGEILALGLLENGPSLV
jgi:hypothetical protein